MVQAKWCKGCIYYNSNKGWCDYSECGPGGSQMLANLGRKADEPCRVRATKREATQRWRKVKGAAALPKPIEQCDIDGNVINTFQSVRKASAATGFSYTAIYKTCNGISVAPVESCGVIFRYCTEKIGN